MRRFVRTARLTTCSALALALGATPAREAAAAPERAVFALVVGNNHSVELGRPELRYADDDSAKYYEVFRMLTADENVHLLTDLDADSARLFPEAQKKAQAPTRAAIKAAAAQIARAASEAQKRGAQVELYFTFAGHGDVDQGKGFLELRDGRFTSDEVEAMLKAIPATRSHVILDSCNSFFVLNARKPGGTRIAVTAAAAKSLSDRLPNVGVFLSTNAEAEVFEWSELQSGIFSHAVRSGILGAADANGDGDVSYDELRAFVEVASEKVKNPLYRPHVFSRGPGGDGRAALFPVQSAKGAKLEIDAPSSVRVTVRDENALPWIDAHKERNAAATLRIPAAWAARAVVEEREVNEYGGRLLHRYSLAGTTAAEPIRLAALTAVTDAEPAPAPRGADEMLRMLFAAPFGPRALAAYQLSAPKAEDEVYGVSREDAQRLDHVLFEAADLRESERYTASGTQLLMGTAAVASSIALLTTNLRKEESGQIMIGGLAAAGAFGLGGGLYTLLVPSDEEKLYRDFRTSFSATSSAGLPSLVARTEARLFDLAAAERRHRLIGASILAASTLLDVAAIAAFHSAPELSSNSQMYDIGLGTVAAFTGLTSAMYFIYPTPIERFSRVWATDTSRRSLSPPSVSLSPLSKNGTLTGGWVTVSGVF